MHEIAMPTQLTTSTGDLCRPVSYHYRDSDVLVLLKLLLDNIAISKFDTIGERLRGWCPSKEPAAHFSTV